MQLDRCANSSLAAVVYFVFSLTAVHFVSVWQLSTSVQLCSLTAVPTCRLTAMQTYGWPAVLTYRLPAVYPCTSTAAVPVHKSYGLTAVLKCRVPAVGGQFASGANEQHRRATVQTQFDSCAYVQMTSCIASWERLDSCTYTQYDSCIYAQFDSSACTYIGSCVRAF